MLFISQFNYVSPIEFILVLRGVIYEKSKNMSEMSC